MADEETIIQDEIEQLQDRDDVRAIAVVGSYARDPAGQHNDIDLYIIVDGDWRKRETERIDSTVIERFYNSMDWNRRYLEGEGWYTNYRWFTRPDIRYDPDGLFEELEAYAMEKKDENMDLDDEERQAIRYFIWDHQQDIEQAEGAQETFLIHKLFEYLLEKHYLLQGEVPVKENYRIEKLTDFDEEMYDLATTFLEAEQARKRELIEEIIDHVTADLGEPDPEYETAREVLD